MNNKNVIAFVIVFVVAIIAAIPLSTSISSATLNDALPKRRGRPLRSAPKPCVRLVASHGSSRMQSVVIDTPCRIWHAFGRGNVGEERTCC